MSVSKEAIEAALETYCKGGWPDNIRMRNALTAALPFLARPDPAEAMRAKCEMIAWDYAESATDDDSANDVANSIKRTIAALKVQS